MLGPIFDGLDEMSEPIEFFVRADAPDQQYMERAGNSEKHSCFVEVVARTLATVCIHSGHCVDTSTPPPPPAISPPRKHLLLTGTAHGDFCTTSMVPR